MKSMKWMSLLMATCMLVLCLLSGMPAVTAEEVAAEEEEIILATPVDEEVEETETADLWTEEIAKDVAEAEAAAEEATAAEEAAKPGDGDFQIVNGVLVKYNGTGGDVVVPDGVRVIGESAFCECYNLTGITLPDSVTSIGDYAFIGCRSLTSITLPDGVTSIGKCTFFGCSSLTSITLPDSMTSIGEAAFESCSSLTSIALPDAVTSIGYGAFELCKNLTSITLPDGLTSIGGYAFAECSSLTSITLSDGLTSIGEATFSYCTSLTSITLPDSMTSIGVYAFLGCSGLTSITLPDSLTSIGNSAFCSCSGLTSITLPDSVTSIGVWAFRACTMLTSITLPDSVTSIGGNTFAECSSLKSVILPNGLCSIGENAFYKCTELTSITLPDSVTSIRDNAFRDCQGLLDVTISATGAIQIEDSAFSNCSAAITFHTVCETPVTIWARERGYTVDASPHTPGEMIPAVPATCTSTGLTEGRECSVCGGIAVEQQVTPTIPHDSDSIIPAVPATCTATGLTEGRKCSKCGKITVEQQVTPRLTDEDIDINEENFPDAKMRKAIRAVVDTDDDGALSPMEAAVQAIDISSRSITDLTGIGVFKNLRILNCSDNDLASMAGLSNKKLEDLNCSNNLLTGLDVSGRTKLKSLRCGNNLLTSLNVSGCTELTSLEYSGNNPLKLNISGCTAIKELVLDTDELVTELNASGCTALQTLRCNNNLLTTLKLKNCTKLVRVYAYKNPLQEVDITGSERLIALVGTNPTFDYQGIEDTVCFGNGNMQMAINASTKVVVNGEALYAPGSISNCKITGIKAQTYIGKAIKPAPVVKYKGRKLIKGTDYTVSWKNNKKVGLATVIVKGKGNYTGSRSATFKINPKKVALTKLTTGKGKLTVQWKKSAGAGYEIQYGLKKNFSGAKSVTIGKSGTVKKVLKKLKSGKTYYVRIRGYKKVGGKEYVSKWSKAKKAKVK